jgi:hypothetical protein
MSTIGFLPFEKIPLFVWCMVVAAVGGFLAYVEGPFTWPQIRGLVLLMVGLLGTAYDLWRRARSRPTGGSSGGACG